MILIEVAGERQAVSSISIRLYVARISYRRENRCPSRTRVFA